MIAGELRLPAELWSFFRKCSNSVLRGLGLVLTALVLKLVWDRERPGFYGLSWRGFNATPYLSMLAIMAPLIVWASFQPAFLATYPIYTPDTAPEYLGWPSLAAIGVHELCYAQRFVGVEVFFRGVLLLGMVRWMGRAALMPMVVLYALWHFGKPFEEAVGSVFGGYFLGVIALCSRRITGGVIVHMGVALLMNWAAYAQLWWRSP
jgi:hypothetical protein